MANRWKFDHRKSNFNLSTNRWSRPTSSLETKKPNEIVGAVKLWINTELSKSLVNHLSITFGANDSIKIHNRPEFSTASRSLTIYFADDHLYISTDFGDDSSGKLQYCDPGMFDQLRLLISRVHNG